MSHPTNERAIKALAELARTWAEEFARAVEVFTGERPLVSLSGELRQASLPDVSRFTWWKQAVQEGHSSCIWAGAAESLWTALGDGTEVQSTLFEIFRRANQGTAAALNLHFQGGAVETPALPFKGEVAEINVSFRGAAIGAVILLADHALLTMLTRNTTPAMLSRLMDLRLPVSVVLGRSAITIKDALKLAPGSVVELDRHAGDPVEIIVHGTVVARGDIVSVKGNYGVRITEVISRQDRIALHEAA